MSRELTADEVFLLDYVRACNSGYKLYKFYGSEEEIDNRIPDIWNMLLDERDEAEEGYDEARLEYAQKDANAAFWYKHHVDGCRLKVDSVNRLIEEVEKSSADYFAYFAAANSLVPISKQSQTIYKAAVVEGKISFKDTGEVIDVWTPESRIGAYTYSMESSDGKLLWVNSSCFTASGYYVFTFGPPDLEMLNRDRRVVCTDCGRIFQLSDGEVNFYAQKKLELPKRCKTCREIRKVTRDCKKSSGTSYFEKMMRYI